MPRRRSEQALYRPVADWFRDYLAQIRPRGSVTVLHHCHARKLGSVIDAEGFSSSFPAASSWEVRVDVVGFRKRPDVVRLGFVEVKVRPITLLDIGQLWGYSQICQPLCSFLVSPEGLSTELERLLRSYGREDVLNYAGGKIQVGRWNTDRHSFDWSTAIPGGPLPDCSKPVRP